MKNSIKRAQSQACLGFAEQKNFRPLAKHLKRLSLTLLLLITAATGAWADWTGGTYTATTNEELGAITVGADATLTINEGVTVTVSGGINANGHTLTVKGAGMLTVTGTNGTNGADGGMYDGGGGGNGSAGFTGTLIVDGATVNVTGGNGGNGGGGLQYGGNGGNGAAGVSGSITLNSGSVTVTGGAGGNGGKAYMQNGTIGSAGQAVTETITASTAEESDDNSTWTAISGTTSLKRYVRADSTAPAVEVTISDDKSEASFQMPQYDLTATYTLKRDMTVDVAGEMADRIRIKKDGNDYQAVDATQMNPVVKDNLETNSPVTLTVTTDYTLQLQKQSETNADEWTDATALSVGTFRYKITGAGNYSGICYSEEFALFEGYEIKVAAGEYATFYKDEPLYADTETSGDAVLYTISSVSADKAVLSSAITTAPSLTPLLVFNSSEETKAFLLIPADAEPNLVLTVAPEFKGTLEATTIAASTDEQNNYALNGKQFVWVKDALPVAANKAWLAVPVSTSNARRLVIVFDETTGIDVANSQQPTANSYYDLNGRKLNAVPTKKGVYILNGRKVVIK